ncbi:BZ3500_MvSof-1268-A1-R1_Chr2-2g05020 [Microbotryum saponariae]|uniref:BZ3500_MvSof-1268-A1-R1_Chr2-2g05020 protein n=1 Tax=Microbotryum saponariae TaxID=289078 RepID=A0A2X0L7W4_9BASI|nr:BZ3500_MvSof-1268-A1-R1_Chr2-2g05020 [Microbotryum saponariae]SDA00718.1 BZ3501_MvSof-1269-A2-R1_Chr2-2g04694 [Microbotryum saponariae]
MEKQRRRHELDPIRAICDAITPILNRYDFFRCDLISKQSSSPRAILHSARFLFPKTSCDGGSDQHPRRHWSTTGSSTGKVRPSLCLRPVPEACA